MSKVTSKLQVTLPKSIADHYGVRPGDEIDWEIAGETIRVIPQSARSQKAGEQISVEERLRRFDQATARQLRRQRSRGVKHAGPEDRGWTREDLYQRGIPR